MQSMINTVEYPTLLCKSRCAREASPQHRYLIFFEITSLQLEDLRRLAKPNQGQTGISSINNVNERLTLRPMPRKTIIEP